MDAKNDLVVVVTGASSGMGRAVARAFGARGAHVGLVARNVEALDAAARKIRDAGGGPSCGFGGRALRCDFRGPDV